MRLLRKAKEAATYTKVWLVFRVCNRYYCEDLNIRVIFVFLLMLCFLCCCCCWLVVYLILFFLSCECGWKKFGLSNVMVLFIKSFFFSLYEFMHTYIRLQSPNISNQCETHTWYFFEPYRTITTEQDSYLFLFPARNPMYNQISLKHL